MRLGVAGAAEAEAGAGPRSSMGPRPGCVPNGARLCLVSSAALGPGRVAGGSMGGAEWAGPGLGRGLGGGLRVREEGLGQGLGTGFGGRHWGLWLREHSKRLAGRTLQSLEPA